MLNGPKVNRTNGWVRAIREALGMSEYELAARAGVTQQRINQIQAAEADGSVQLSTLRRVADALDCDLVCYLAPRLTLDDMVWRQAFVKAAEEVGCDPDDPEESSKAVRLAEEVEDRAPFWVDRRGLWRKGPEPGS